MTSGGTLHRSWERFWFAPGSAFNLAVARIVIAVHALWVLLSRDLAGVSDTPGVFWGDAPAAARWRFLIFPGHGTLEALLQWAAAACLVAVAFGLYHRMTCLAAGLLLYHLAPLETLFWTSDPFERGFEVTVLSLITLALAPSADALSLRRQAIPARDASEYQWPLKLIQVFVAQIYLFSGYSKLFRVGFEWISATNLRAWLLVFDQQDQVAVFRGLGVWIADRPALGLAIAALTVAFELAFVVVLFVKRAWMVFVPVAVAFHTGILFAMNIAFLNAPQLLVFVDWDWLARRRVECAGRRLHRKAQDTPPAQSPPTPETPHAG